MSNLKILIRKRYGLEGKRMRIVHDGKEGSNTPYPAIDKCKMLKYCMLMECGIEDRYRLIFKQENGL
jgi:hypothetical protein